MIENGQICIFLFIRKKKKPCQSASFEAFFALILTFVPHFFLFCLYHLLLPPKEAPFPLTLSFCHYHLLLRLVFLPLSLHHISLTVGEMHEALKVLSFVFEWQDFDGEDPISVVVKFSNLFSSNFISMKQQSILYLFLFPYG